MHVCAGPPVDLVGPATDQPLDRGRAARGHRPAHGRASPSCSRSSAARRARPSGSTPAGPASPRSATRAAPRWKPPATGVDRACPDGEDRNDDARRRHGHRQLGHGLRRDPRRRRGRGARCGADAPRSSTQINAGHVNTDYLPDLVLPAAVSATTDPAEALDGADIVVLAVPSQTLRANLAGLGRPAAGRRRRRLADEGRRARHDDADERGHRRGRRRRARARRRGVRPQPRPRDRRATSRRRAWSPASTWRPPSASRARARRRTSGPTPTPTSIGTELGGAVKNVVALAVGHGRGHGLRRQHEGHHHHPRPRRDHPAGCGPRRRPGDLRGPRRRRRPHRHVHVAALAQPHVRGPPRSRHDRCRR